MATIDVTCGGNRLLLSRGGRGVSGRFRGPRPKPRPRVRIHFNRRCFVDGIEEKKPHLPT